MPYALCTLNIQVFLHTTPIQARFPSPVGFRFRITVCTFSTINPKHKPQNPKLPPSEPSKLESPLSGLTANARTASGP